MVHHDEAGEPWLDHGTTSMVELRYQPYHGRFCRETPILVLLDNSVDLG